MKRFGAHISSEKGYEWAVREAVQQGLTAMQIVFGPPQRGVLSKATVEDLSFTRVLVEHTGLEIYVHMPYVLNTCSLEKEGWIKKVFSDSIDRAQAIGAKGIVWHPGSYKDLTPEEGIKIFQKYVEYFLTKSGDLLLLPENTAGRGSALANDLDRLLRMIEPFPRDRVKFTLDLAHGYAAGYDWNDQEKTSVLVEKIKDHVGLVHCNNTNVLLGSGRDLHCSINDTQASIKQEPLFALLRQLSYVPHILERGVSIPEDEVKTLRDI